MSVIDILFRVDEICKKYDKYDVDKQRDVSGYGDDAFARLYAALETDLHAVLSKSELVSSEKNRAAAVALNAEIRRTKARLMEELPKLQKLARKKVKGLSQDEQSARDDLVLALSDRIKDIPDGSTAASKQGGGWSGTTSNNKIRFDSSSPMDMNPDFFEQSEESSQFRNEYEMRKLKQDQGLDIISEGLDVLKNLAVDMNEEIDRQVPLIDEIDTKVERATSDVKKTNVRLKQTLTQIRSTRNFCIDIILLIVLLGIASYLYNVLK